MHGLPAPGSGTFSLWLIVDGHPRPLGDFRPDTSGAASLATSRAIGHEPTIAVTLEGNRGNRLPTGPTILQT
jgi:hypothetical protein